MKKFTITCLLSLGLLWLAQPSFAQTAQIELIGTSMPSHDWISGEEMNTADGVNYYLLNYYLSAGMLKFRKYQDWSINWGNIAFPSGTATQNGSNMVVTEGTYNIYFNRESGVYHFECISSCTSPAIGILGDAVPPLYWTGNVKMSTLDGIIYTLNYTLTEGTLQFIQDDNLDIRFGGQFFPSGEANSIYYILVDAPGDYVITYNRSTGAYSFVCAACPLPSIGIIGTSVGGWDEDVDLSTSDGIHYSLLNYTLAAGEVKFRKNNSWLMNWGTYWGAPQFPEGDAVYGGANIPVPAGRYNIYLDLSTAAYRFTPACDDPQITCPADIRAVNDPGSCSAALSFNLPEVNDPCGTALLTQTAGIASGGTFPVGTTTNQFVIAAPGGGTTGCSFTVTVSDTEAPVISNLSASPAVLWPPNHQLIDVSLLFGVTDNCGVANVTVQVSSNEPVNGTGDGDHAPDWLVIDHEHLQLRAERSAKGAGRIYTIMVTATDLSGNRSYAYTTVTVPRSMTVSGRLTGPEQDSEHNLTVTANPNPATGSFGLRVLSDFASPVQVRITDLSGRQLSGFTLRPGTWIQTGHQLKPGIYFAECMQDHRRSVIRLVKQ